MLKKKSQAWSMDVILAVVIFIGAFFLYYVLASSNRGEKTGNLKEDALSVLKQISSEGSSLKIIDRQTINDTKIGELKNMNYDQLKNTLRVNGDFCIYIEDDQGKIVPINQSYMGVGSSSMNISGIPCGQK